MQKSIQYLHADMHMYNHMHIPYSRKIWRRIKFGGLAVYLNNRQIKIRQNFLLAYIRVAIPYRTAKLNSTNTFAMAIWDPTAKFNSRQYFQLYGILTHAYCIIHMHIAHIHVRNSCKTLIGVQEMHGRMHPN